MVVVGVRGVQESGPRVCRAKYKAKFTAPSKFICLVPGAFSTFWGILAFLQMKYVAPFARLDSPRKTLYFDTQVYIIPLRTEGAMAQLLLGLQNLRDKSDDIIATRCRALLMPCVNAKYGHSYVHTWA